MKNELNLQLLMDQPFTLSSLLFKHYKQLGITDIQFLILLHIRLYHQEGNEFPTPNDLIFRMSLNEQECTQQLKQLLTKRFIEIVEVKGTDKKISEAISIKPLFEKLQLLLNEDDENKEQKKIKMEEGQLFKRFEEEFARPLSPMEMEMISMWLDEDEHQAYIIEAALREAVVSSKMNFRYIDRILFDWKRNGVHSVEQAKAYGEKVRQHHQSSKSSKNNQRSDQPTPQKRNPGYNWLEGKEN